MLLWALVLLFLIMFMFAIFVMQIVADYGTGDQVANATQFYGTLIRSIYTLYMAICGGIDWGQASEPLLEISPVLGFAFGTYIAFAVLCVMNIITGVFVENANQITSRDEDNLLLEDLSNRQRWLGDVKQLFEDVDDDGSGEVEFKEFERHLQDDRIQLYFRKLGVELESEHTRKFFDLLDFDSDGRLNLDEFVLGLSKLHGKARSIDVAHLLHNSNRLSTQLAALTSLVENAFANFVSEGS